ncbi:24333_t:CDS:2 [Dentiscutata erythropus]|uniref:24333_t:CDS:1 n=1 Tax=Dentiscutata erythropus TaxID=1348616 RepID=A0A9N9C3B5_9GLOM|nr:24333_t:CDS:2 [Dentiscutata erythropus]
MSIDNNVEKNECDLSNSHINNDNINLSEIFNFQFESKEQIDNLKESKKLDSDASNQSHDQIDEVSTEKTCVLRNDYDGWFHTSMQTNKLLTQKLGPNRLKQSIEYHYFHKNYKEALRLSLEYTDFVESCNVKGSNELNPNRLTNTRDMLEIAARSALKLGNIELAVKCVDKLAGSSNEPGHMSFKGMIYAQGGRFSDSIKCYIKYHQMRKNDYNTWKEIGNTLLSYYFQKILSQSSDFQSYSPIIANTFITQVALLSFHRSLKIMTNSKWKTSLPFINSRYTREKNQIEELIKRLEHIDAQEAFSFLEKHCEGELFGFDVDIIRWILMECKTSVSEVLEMDKERSVNEL